MQRVHDASLAAIDLNLLPALDALLVECHVTRAAARVGLSQSAMSHALQRLRQQTGDPLLVRTTSGLVRTKRADAMLPVLERALADVKRLFAQSSFDPMKESRVFRIGTTDYAAILLLPQAAQVLAQKAPGISLRVVDTPDFVSALSEGHIDLAIAPRGSSTASGLVSMQLWTDRFVCAVRRGHPLASARSKSISLSAYAAASHVLVAPRDTEGSFGDDALARLGLRRHVAVRVPHFMLAPHLAASSDLVLTLPVRVAERMEPMLGLRILAPPSRLRLPSFAMAAIWHERAGGDPAHRWLRDTIAEIARAL